MRSIKWLSELWKDKKRLVLLLVALSVANAFLAVAYPLYMRAAIDAIKDKAGMEAVSRNVLILLLLGLANFLVYSVMQGTRAWTNIRFERDIRQRVFGHLIRLGRSFFQKYRTGDIVTRMTDDISTEIKLSWFACSGIFRTVEALCIIILGLIVMVRLNPLLTLAAVGPLPVLIIIFMWTSSAVQSRYERLQERISDVNAHMEACFSGIRVVKAYRRERAQRNGFHGVMERRKHAEIDAVKVGTIIESMYGYIWQFGVIIVLLVGGKMVMDGTLSLGTLVAFDAYVFLLVFPMYDLGSFFVQGKRAGVSIRRLVQMESVKPEVSEPAKPKALPSTLGALRFENVTLSLGRDGANVLDDISFEAKPGELVALVGKVGSGKSCVVNLIPRLFDPTSGDIFIDGVSTRELSLETLRSAVGFVPQEPLLFSDSIENNIRFHRDWITRDEIISASEVARLKEEVEQFPEGFATIIGQRGATISGGQKQRVALARALAGRPKVLILDDCTASLDAETEAALWERLHDVFPHCTTVVISHRAATLEKADRILVLDRGKIVERGTHAELVSKRGVYHTLYELGKLKDEVGGDWAK
jgi:ATP-binding cassette subfamily B multidrug efflux pump